MSDVAETINEAVEAARESRLNSIIALLVSITATFMAICNVKAGNVGQGMQQAQAGAIDSWAYYQAKGMKQNIAEATLDQLTMQRDLGGATLNDAMRTALDKKIADYAARVKKYESEKNDIKKQAETYEKQYDALNVHDDQFDLSDAALSITIALFGVTALTQKRWLMIVAIVFMAIGFAYGCAGLFNLSLHSDFAAKLLS